MGTAMSVRERLDDARVLWAAGRKEGAFLLILCAADATARKRYPDMGVGDRFRQYIRDEMAIITGGPKYGVVLPFDGGHAPLEDILYRHLRCSFVHEGMPSPKIVFTDPVEKDGVRQNVVHLREPLGLPINFAWNLFRALCDSPENGESQGSDGPREPKATDRLIRTIQVLSDLHSE